MLQTIGHNEGAESSVKVSLGACFSPVVLRKGGAWTEGLWDTGAHRWRNADWSEQLFWPRQRRALPV